MQRKSAGKERTFACIVENQDTMPTNAEQRPISIDPAEIKHQEDSNFVEMATDLEEPSTQSKRWTTASSLALPPTLQESANLNR
jgi:hypothetical protein